MQQGDTMNANGMNLHQRLRHAVGCMLLTLMAGCGGGGGGSDDGAEPSRVTTAQSLLGGTVTGLDDSSDALVIMDEVSHTSVQVRGGASAFALPGKLDLQTAYRLRITQQPAAQYCTLANASGIVSAESERAAALQCVHYSVRTAVDHNARVAWFAMGGRIGGVARDSQGNVYLTDVQNHAIRKVSPSGRVSTWAGLALAGHANGQRLDAMFSSPAGLAMGPDGAVYVADAGNNVVRRILADGAVEDFAGAAGSPGLGNGGRQASTFKSPDDLLFDRQGNLFVSDAAANQIRMIAADGTVSLIAGDPAGAAGDNIEAPIQGSSARFSRPMGLAWASDGALLVADSGNGSIRALRKDTGGTWWVSSLARKADYSTIKIGLKAPLTQPERLAVDAEGAIHVMSYFDVAYRIDKARAVSLSPFGTEGNVNLLDFSQPGRVLAIGSGSPYDFARDRHVQVFEDDPTGQLLATYVDTQAFGYRDGNGSSVTLANPRAVTLIGQGNRVVATSGAQFLLYGADGGVRPLVVRWPEPWSTIAALASDGAGNLYVAGTTPSASDAGRIVKLDHTGKAGTLASVGTPISMAFDARTLSLYLVDAPGGAPAFKRVSVVDGSVTPVSLPSAVTLSFRSALANDGAGNLLIGEGSGPKLHKVTVGGQLLSTQSIAAKEDPANQLSFAPTGMAVDSEGNLLVACYAKLIKNSDLFEYSTVRKVNQAGVVRTIAGWEQGNVNGDGQNALLSFPASPLGMVYQEGLGLYLPDGYNNALRLVY
jgi:sugar lactone lactonase YvrE